MLCATCAVLPNGVLHRPRRKVRVPAAEAARAASAAGFRLQRVPALLPLETLSLRLLLLHRRARAAGPERFLLLTLTFRECRSQWIFLRVQSPPAT